jgi:hypothetical protein
MNEFDVVSATITGFLFRRYSASLNCDDNGCSLSSLTPSCGWSLSDSWNCTASLGIVSGVNIGVEVSGNYKIIRIIDQ